MQECSVGECLIFYWWNRTFWIAFWSHNMPRMLNSRHRAISYGQENSSLPPTEWRRQESLQFFYPLWFSEELFERRRRTFWKKMMNFSRALKKIVTNLNTKQCSDAFCDGVITPLNEIACHVGICQKCGMAVCLKCNEDCHGPLVLNLF